MAMEVAVTQRLRHLSRAMMPGRAARARALDERADRLARGGRGDVTWWRARAAGLGVLPVDRTEESQAVPLELVSLTTGEIREVCRCRMPTCQDCQGARMGRYLRHASLCAIALDEQYAAVGMTIGETPIGEGCIGERRECVMLTFSLRDSGHPDDDAARFREAWPVWRAAAWREWGKVDFFRRQECTAGERAEKDGHVHVHMAAWLPAWFDYGKLHRWWWRALGWQPSIDAATGMINCGCSGFAGERGAEPCPSHVPGGVRVDRRREGESHADAIVRYASKIASKHSTVAYVLKNESAFDDFDTDALASYLNGQYGKREIAVSRGFWQLADKPVPEYEVLEIPTPLTKAAARWWTPLVDDMRPTYRRKVRQSLSSLRRRREIDAGRGWGQDEIAHHPRL